MDSNDHEYSLVCPFLNESLDYTLGVELGMLFERMKRTRRITDYFHLNNQEQILLLANRTGWKVEKIKDNDESWFFLEMTKPKSRL